MGAGGFNPPEPEAEAEAAARAAEEGEVPEHPHLRSAEEVSTYGVGATDGHIGHVDDLLYQVGQWAIRYLVVDTRDWLPGRKVLVAPDWVENIEWNRRHVHVDHTRRQIEESPEFEPAEATREYESRLHDHYKRTAYWE
ncbi:MAG: hypothetical protein ACOC7T_01330 [Planctomycetota bacterium]